MIATSWNTSDDNQIRDSHSKIAACNERYSYKPYVNTKANVISPLPVKPRACNSLYRNLSVILTTSSSFSRLFSLNSLANWFYTSRVASWCWCPTYKVSIFLLLVNKYLRNYFWNVTFSYDRVRLVFKLWRGKTPSKIAIITHRLDFRNF